MKFMWINGQWVCNPIIPTVFDESLSYYETICKLNQIVQDLNKRLDNFQSDYENYTDTEISKLKKYTENLIDNLTNKVNEEVSNLYLFISNEDKKIYDDIIKRYEYLIDYVNTTDEINRVWTLTEINKVIELVNEINEDGFLVYNPFRGYKTKMQIVINDIFNAMRKFALSALAYDNLKLSADEYDKKHLSALTYDLYGKIYLIRNFGQCHMFSPFNGLYTLISDVVNDLALLHKKALTALEYDNLNFTVTSYDEKNMSAYNYDWLANS